MPLIEVAVAVALLLLLMTKFKLNGFVSLLLVAGGVALWAVAKGDLTVDGESAGVSAIPDIIAEGVGGQLGSTLMVIGLGAMIGRVMGDAGAAQRMAMKIVEAFGVKRVQWAMVLTSVLIGLTMFYETAFVIIVPVAFTLVQATKSNLLWVGLPMSITLSTMHSFLPPSPGPVAAAGTYGASVGLTLVYGLFIAIPVGVLIAMLWPRLSFVKKMNPSIPKGLVSEKEFAEDEMPATFTSIAVAVLPVILIGGAEMIKMFVDEEAMVTRVFSFIGAPEVALLLTLLVAVVVFGPMNGISLTEVGKSMSESARGMAMIIMVIGAGGAFAEVLTAAGIADYIAELTQSWSMNPIILVWVIAAFMRLALGSATVAVLTAAGIAAPLAAASGVPPEIMVLATSCGSIAFSHVNDPGFWLFKEYFNLSVIEAIKTRTSYTTVLGLLGLGGTLLVNVFV
ncbi:MAG TPA: gluconate:H+ symporter [Candidatus Corynebacterium avicola]|uniref:Gluconate:H+ symporter n=1 Tax=Candidatus Corynebacterium avicola TaxID=2838527 RepID=A0A9D1RM56_9CORY|nr:gluconate:H+ symporter [Candidatus Corynebacterium avicola]